jgi:uncharacterized protein YtpQ (UPF0354 family)
MAAMTREQFVEKVSEHIRIKFPLVKLARGEQPFSLRINEQTTSLENIYRITMLNPTELQRHVERWVVEIIRAGEGSPDQSASFEELRERIYPMILSAAAAEPHTSTMITQPLVGSLVVAYAVDSDRTIAYIPGAHFDSWGITLEELHETAIANLVSRSDNIQAHAAQDDDESINLVLFQTLDGYDASRILLPTLHERLREHLGSPFAAAIPNRDILLCFRNDDATVARLHQQIKQDYRQMPHQITDKLLLVTADGIALH